MEKINEALGELIRIIAAKAVEDYLVQSSAENRPEEVGETGKTATENSLIQRVLKV